MKLQVLRFLKKTLEGPMRQIVANAGLEESIIVNEVRGIKVKVMDLMLELKNILI